MAESPQSPSSRAPPVLAQLDTARANTRTSISRRPLPSDASSPRGTPVSPEDSRVLKQSARYSPVRVHSPQIQVHQPSSAVIETTSATSPPPGRFEDGPSRPQPLPQTGTHVRNVSAPILEASDPIARVRGRPSGTSSHLNSLDGEIPEPQQPAHLQYHHEKVEEKARNKHAQTASRATIGTMRSSSSDGQTVSSLGEHSQGSAAPQNPRLSVDPHLSIGRARFSPGVESQGRGRSLTPQGMRSESPRPGSTYTRNLSVGSSQRLSELRPASMVDLLQIPYSQQMAHQMMSQDHTKLQGSMGSNVSLLDSQQTLDMYRANVKKTNNMSVQFQFALFMVDTAQELDPNAVSSRAPSPNPTGEPRPAQSRQKELLKEARSILRSLSDKGQPFAQYYLADGYASGLFNNGKPDQHSAFNLFIAASKHGHAEAAYRTALCFEFGWGSRRDVAKAVQYLRSAASKGHPGAAVRLGKACLVGDMGQHGKYREGIKWLKRATENADRQYNAGPFELGLLHVNGYGADVFKDEGYAAQLFTKAADLGHPEANMRMGDVYEHGLLTCPKDPALSIHFYTGAAQAGLPDAMMALCAWYMVGAEPVLDKDEAEAFEWAKRAAAQELPKAEYAVGYFTEMGIGCRRDPLEANVWYVRASDHGDERAKHRLAIIRAAETGDAEGPGFKSGSKALKKKGAKGGAGDGGGGGGKDEKDCIVM